MGSELDLMGIYNLIGGVRVEATTPLTTVYFQLLLSVRTALIYIHPRSQNISQIYPSLGFLFWD